MLADDAAVLEVCLGAEGVLASLDPAAVFANVSTVRRAPFGASPMPARPSGSSTVR